MSEPNKYREWILETIDSLRSRKARPDLERICRMVRRRHGSDPDRTRTELEKLIQEQTVLKVSYKGSISYRNAAKVQRKSRKKSEFTGGGGGGGGGGGAEAATERSKHNNGDSPHSFSEQEEGEEDPEPCPEPCPEPPAPSEACSSGRKLKPSDSETSGNRSPSCDVGSGCEEEKASAEREEGLLGEQQGAGGCAPPQLGHGTSAHDASGTRSDTEAARRGKVPALSAADTKTKTYPQQQRQKHAEPLKPKLGAGGGCSSGLGDRLVASVRSLSASRGHRKPLGLKEILGYLSSQERLSEEKLTRGRVRAVMEREVARGRLRRSRCGSISVPVRGLELQEAAADKLVKSALQDGLTERKQPPPSVPENEPMETGSEEEEKGENEEEEEEEEKDDPRSSDEEGGRSLVAMTTEPELIEKTTEEAEDPTSKNEILQQQQQHGDKDTPGLDSLSRTPCPPFQGSSPSRCNSTHLEERDVIPDQTHLEAQKQTHSESTRINHTSSTFSCSQTKTEVGVSSCLLTPTASPRDSGQSEERGMNGGVNSGGFVKCEGVSGSPVEWTVSDVVSYFTEAGFPEQAAAFRTQEIDGKSLLLMQRNDVLTGLSIRLGPALKIYERHVKVLQKTHFEDDDC